MNLEWENINLESKNEQSMDWNEKFGKAQEDSEIKIKNVRSFFFFLFWKHQKERKNNLQILSNR